MSDGMAIDVDETGRTYTVLRCRGRLDARGAPELTSRCGQARERGRHVVINLGGISFISSSGVGALLAVVEESRRARTQVRLAAVPGGVGSVIRLLNLNQFLSISATEDEAREELEAA